LRLQNRQYMAHRELTRKTQRSECLLSKIGVTEMPVSLSGSCIPSSRCSITEGIACALIGHNGSSGSIRPI
ncbi:MAG TPA: hypothetical protein PLR60_16910, partial [Syntrophorhabdaceae bacterium]|nr:hypothetical protein [Syntrophorhabdaceae bacterium]